MLQIRAHTPHKCAGRNLPMSALLFISKWCHHPPLCKLKSALSSSLSPVSFILPAVAWIWNAHTSSPRIKGLFPSLGLLGDEENTKNSRLVGRFRSWKVCLQKMLQGSGLSSVPSFHRSDKDSSVANLLLTVMGCIATDTEAEVWQNGHGGNHPENQDSKNSCGFLSAVVPDMLGSVYSCNGC